jgi:LuxR family maltose regulon positive regulatory protein
MSQREIANELYVSLNTVKTHCKAIYRKLGIGDRKAAVQAARDAGLL